MHESVKALIWKPLYDGFSFKLNNKNKHKKGWTAARENVYIFLAKYGQATALLDCMDKQ
jgi:hypothetical protein